MKYECRIVKSHDAHLSESFSASTHYLNVDATESTALVPETIERRIFVARGQKVMLDSDLAGLYGVTTGNLNQAVKRNASRFPDDFMFRLTPDDLHILLLQNASSSWGGRRHPPYVFTEHGVAMLSSVLRSERAVQMNILIVRAFVRIREIAATHGDLAHRVERLEEMRERHGSVIGILAEEIAELKIVETPVKRPIGFIASGLHLSAAEVFDDSGRFLDRPGEH